MSKRRFRLIHFASPAIQYSLLLAFVFAPGAVLIGAFDPLQPHSELKFKLIDSPDSYDPEEFAVAPAGEHHKALQMSVDFPGVDQPLTDQTNEVELVDSTRIIGIEIGDQAFAFTIESMKDPKAHIVNMKYLKKHFSVTYCNLVDCVRVLVDDSANPIPLHVGGLDIDQQLVFLYDGERYGQMSEGLPLQDFPYERMTFGEWKQRHPDTRICIPPSSVSIEHRKTKDASLEDQS